MKELFEKLVSFWNTNIQSCPLYLGEAPQGASFPYAVYTPIMQISPDTFTEDVEELAIRINIFDDQRSALRIQELFEQVRERLDRAKFTLATFNHVMTRRTASQLFRGDGVWQYSILYEFYIEKGEAV